MEIREFDALIKKGLAGWFLFAGEEEYLKRFYLTQAEKAIVKDAFSAPFNHIVFDGPEVDVPALADAVKAEPMMSDKKIVVWKYADMEHMKEGTRKALESLASLKKEAPHTVVIFLVTQDALDVGTLPKRPSKLYTRLSAIFDILYFPLSTDTQLLSWLKKHFDAAGVGVSADALSALLFRAGHNMDVLSGEVDKLTALAKARSKTEITRADVEEAASSNLESDAFALATAVTDRDKVAAFRALADLKSRKVEPTAVLGMLTRTLGELVSVAFLLKDGKDADDIAKSLKLHPYKVKICASAAKRIGADTLSAMLRDLLATDVSSKSGGLGGYTALELFLAENL